EKTPKPKYGRKNTDSDTSPKQKPVQATKDTRIKTKAKLATKKSKKDFHISHTNSSGDEVDTQSKVPDQQQQKTFGTDEGTGTILEVRNVPIYDSESDKESWGDSDEEDDDEYDFDDSNDSDDNDESDDERIESDRDGILDPDLTNFDQTKHEEENVDERVRTPSDYELTDDENINDEETMYDDEDDEVTKELYEDVNVNLGNKDADMTNADQDFTSKLINLDNPSPADNEIASLMDTTTYHATAIPEITSSFATPTPPPPLFFNPLQQEATPTPTPTTFKATTSFTSLQDFAEAIKKAIQAHNFNCREKAQAEKREYLELADSTSLYEADATLSEFDITKILIDKMEKNKSFDVADYKNELYDALIKSYNTNKDIFESYGEVFSLKRSRDKRDKDQDPFC
nr:hypothetical protein [Tanacetum cinerariifolium]